METELDFILREVDSLHDWRGVDVLCENVALTGEVKDIEGLLWAPVHTLEMHPKRFLDALSKVMLAVLVPIAHPMTVHFHTCGHFGRSHRRRASMHACVASAQKLVVHSITTISAAVVRARQSTVCGFDTAGLGENRLRDHYATFSFVV